MKLVKNKIILSKLIFYYLEEKYLSNDETIGNLLIA